MSSMTFSQRIFQPKPPVQGSFPLDHDGECKQEMLEYMLCMSREKQENSKCRDQTKEFLNCRMNKNLMEKRDLKTFGFDANNNNQKNNNQEINQQSNNK